MAQRAIDAALGAAALVAVIALAGLILRPVDPQMVLTVVVAAMIVAALASLRRRPTLAMAAQRADDYLRSADLLGSVLQADNMDEAFRRVLRNQADALAARHSPAAVPLRHGSARMRAASALLVTAALNVAWLQQVHRAGTASAVAEAGRADALSDATVVWPPAAQTQSADRFAAMNSVADAEEIIAGDAAQGSVRVESRRGGDAAGAGSAQTPNAQVPALSPVTGERSGRRIVDGSPAPVLAPDDGGPAMDRTDEPLIRRKAIEPTAAATAAYRDLIRAYFIAARPANN